MKQDAFVFLLTYFIVFVTTQLFAISENNFWVETFHQGDRTADNSVLCRERISA